MEEDTIKLLDAERPHILGDAIWQLEALQGLQHGFQLAGFSAEEFNASLTRFTRRVGEAVHGGGPLQTTLERYRISVRHANGEMKTQMEMLREIAEAVRSAGTEQEKLAIAQAAFGDVGRRMVNALKGGADGIDDMIQAAHDAGVVMDEELIRKAEEIDRKFAQLSASAAAFSKKLIVGLLAAGAELADFRERLDQVFHDEAEGRAILGDEVYDALAKNRDAVEQNAEALHQLQGEYVRLGDEARAAGMAMLDVIGRLDSWGYDEAADALREAVREMDDLTAAFQRGEISGEDFSQKLGEIEQAATAAFDQLEAGDRVQFGGVISQLQRLGGVIASVTSLAREMHAAIAGSVGQGADQQQGAALRARHAAETASMDSLTAQREAVTKFNEAEAARNSATSEQLRLQREVEAVLKRSSDAGVNLTATEAEAAAAAALAAEDARREAGKAARGGGGRGGRGGSKGGGGRSASARPDEFQREVEAIRDRTRALEAEAASLIAVAASGKEYGDAIEYARKRAELLHAATKAGKALTPELIAEVDKLAEAYVTAGAKAEEAAERMRKVQEQSERGKQALEGIFGAMLEGANSAREAVARLLMEAAKMQFVKGMMALPGMGGLATAIGFSDGGFTGTGGILEPAGIVHRGEYVFSADAVKRIGVRNLEAMHSAASRGYAQGGPVGIPAPAAAGGGTSTIKIALSAGLEAQILEQAKGQSIEITREGLRQYDRTFTQKVGHATRYPRG
ncbi:MAG: hypothetical protein Q4G22_10225 [Paracoccus sp. (in: a-proteobacteria)]|uniref:hypothetical protein n=1 Tax=Paracoccus sp. TaxID=267 RepID=UPI0026E06F9F|nr:hypothetical protein [Paracoccus sp. (in: a-proteobacteria)]MDO5632201.1 hypothetical protein [Paracoccus sp. (in: a-proteobacteria)]